MDYEREWPQVTHDMTVEKRGMGGARRRGRSGRGTRTLVPEKERGYMGL